MKITELKGWGGGMIEDGEFSITVTRDDIEIECSDVVSEWLLKPQVMTTLERLEVAQRWARVRARQRKLSAKNTMRLYTFASDEARRNQDDFATTKRIDDEALRLAAIDRMIANKDGAA